MTQTIEEQDTTTEIAKRADQHLPVDRWPMVQEEKGKGHNRPGRPMKYRHLIEALEPGLFYCPATIVNHALTLGLLDNNKPPEELKAERTRIRHTLSRYTDNHQFPEEGDGLIIIEGQGPICGWYGRRWQEALPHPFNPKYKTRRTKPKPKETGPKPWEIINQESPR